ncbi:hypothetical protein HDU97_001829 [Phlyctochytrium planicorne]|nr:hypothetical protein HDU97_001829 [Phlyctochytrium planicorne]
MPRNLPNEIIHQILLCLDIGDLLSTSQVASQWREAARSKYIWEQLDVSLTLNGLLSTVEVKNQRKNKMMGHRISELLAFCSIKAIPMSPAFLDHYSDMLAHIRKLQAPFHDLTEPALRSALTSLPNLRHINLSGCWELRQLDAFAIELPVLCKKLTALDLASTLVTGKDLCHILSHCPMIKHLNVSSCPRIRQECLAPLATLVCERDVERFWLRSCHHLTTSVSITILSILGNSRSLRVLDLSRNSGVNASSLKALVNTRILRQLEQESSGQEDLHVLHVDIKDCELITKKGVADISEGKSFIKFSANPVMRDNTPEAISEYLHMLLGSQHS